MGYTYDDFLKAANDAGIIGEFSRYDLDLAQKHPEFGLSVLSLKQDFKKATTAEQKTLINQAANELRKSYGNYTGGADGSKYYAGGLKEETTGSFAYPSAPAYENRYADQQKRLLDELLNRGEFSWSKEEDPLWSSYKKSYLREGERATANALAQASAATGGRASSFAVNAAGQAGDYYAAKLNDMIPTLHQQAYDRYQDEYNMKLQDLSALSAQEQLEYAKYLDQLEQYNADRNFRYGEYRDTLGDQRQAEETEYNRNLYLQELEREQQAQQKSSAQAQVDAMLASGATPSAQLAAEAGYSDEYVRALAQAYRQAAGTGSKAAAGDGTGRGGNASTYQSMYDAGIKTEGGAYDYALRAGYSSTEAAKLAGYFQAWLEDIGTEPAGPGGERAGLDGGMSIPASQLNRTISGMLQTGDSMEKVSAVLDLYWNRLTPEQQEDVQRTLAAAGLAYEPG